MPAQWLYKYDAVKKLIPGFFLVYAKVESARALDLESWILTHCVSVTLGVFSILKTTTPSLNINKTESTKVSVFGP